MRRDDLLDLNDVLQHPGRKLEVDVTTELEEEADVDLIAPLEGVLEAMSSGNLLFVKGMFRTKIVVECARCTSPIETALEFELDEQFLVEGIPSSLSAQDYARVVADEPFPLFEGNCLLVENLLRQGLLLAIPNQPLCEYGWEGDCPNAVAMGVDSRVSEADTGFGSLKNLIENPAANIPKRGRGAGH